MKKKNINKTLKVFLSKNYVMDTIIQQSSLDVPDYIRAVVTNTTRMSHEVHKSEAISMLLDGLGTILDGAKAADMRVKDAPALYLIMCSLGNSDLLKMYGLKGEQVLDDLSVDFTVRDLECMMYLFNALAAKYGTFTISSPSKVNFKKYKPKKEKRPRDKSQKIKTVKKKDKTRNVMKAKAKKEKRLNALREKLAEIKKVKENSNG